MERGISEAGMGSPEKCTVGKELSAMRSCLTRRHSMLKFIVGYTHPFDRSGSDDVDTFIYQHSSSDSAWHSR